MVGGELIEGLGGLMVPAYREVIVTVPRQSGKTTLILSWQVQRSIGWSGFGPQRTAYSAQTGNDARKKLIEDQVPILEPHRAKLQIKRVLRGMGNEAVEFKNGSRIVLLASSSDSGHGKTLDLGVKDELFADVDDRRDQAMVPAMATRPAAQMVTTSTMGTALSVPLNRAVERGRAAVQQGATSGVAYFEWSAPDDADPDDPSVWWGCMPALGHTITEDVVRHARATLSLSEFRRAFLNIVDGRRGDPVIPSADWAACADTASRPEDPVVLAFDVTPDRSAASIGAAGGDHVAVTDHHQGTGWVVSRLLELKGRYRPSMIVCDATGPAGGLLSDLARAGVEVHPVSTNEHKQACGAFFDAIKERRLHHPDQAALNAAVEGADRRVVADAWLWSRKASAADISPLVAVTLAKWGADQKQSEPMFVY